MIFYDSETCGFHGMAVLLQYAFDRGAITLHDIWRKPIKDTLELIREFMNHDMCGFNLAFDHFHLVKLWTTFDLFVREGGDPNSLPQDHIERLAILEERARFHECTIKPKRAIDLMLHARRGPYQTLMGRSDIKIRRIPAVLADKLATELNKRIAIDDIYFSRSKSTDRWKAVERKDGYEFKDVVLKFKASGSLKTLAEHALKVDKTKILRMSDVEVSKQYLPLELGYAPYALAISDASKGWKAKLKVKGQWRQGKAWPAMIDFHISHWQHNKLARQYAEDDVTYTRDLYDFFDRPEPGDDDSELACAVACCRWHGYAVDIEGIKEQKVLAIEKMKQVPISSARARDYITGPMTPDERVGFGTLTGKTILEKMIKDQTWNCDCVFEKGEIDPECKKCSGTGRHLAVRRAAEVLEARFAKKEIELFDKTIRAGRLHASFIVIGALSSRMSGTDGLNPQGVKRTKDVRRCFTLADQGFELWGGDFDAFEVVIADSAYYGALQEDLTTIYDCFECKTTGRSPAKKCKVCNAGTLRNKLCWNCDGKGLIPESACEDCGGTGHSPRKIHGLFSMEMFPGKTYEQIMGTKGKVPDLYTLGKNGVFSMIYGGDWGTLVRKYGVEEEAAQRAFKGFIGKRPGIKKAQQYILDGFQSMRQPAGAGTRVEWHDPKEYIESLFEFRRYFTLENMICKALFDLAANLPKSWRDMKIRITRNVERGPQFVGGAASSALYGAAFGIQGSNVRAATNHVIQSSGATVTKAVQRKVWDVQPYGIHPLRVVPCNIHDELLCPTLPEFVPQVRQAVHDAVESFRSKIPLIKFEYKPMKNWAMK